MNSTETGSLTAETLVGKISKYLANHLDGRKFTAAELNSAVKFHLGEGVEPDYHLMEKSIWDLAVLCKELGLNTGEFVAVFGRELDELLFESLIFTNKNETVGTNVVVQLFHRNQEQVKVAHALLCTKGVRLDAVIPESSSAGGYWATSTLLFSTTI